MVRGRFFIALLAAATAYPAKGSTQGGHAPAVETRPDIAPDRAAMDAVVRDLCNRDVAMLGEADHGDGATTEFKVRLVQRLVDECGFSAMFFEGSHYDFLEFSRRLRAGEPATPAMLSSAIGGLWNRQREFAPLIPFLFARARSGRLALGGIDDQLGSAGAFYSIAEMPARLTFYLAGERRAQCSALLRRRIYYDYPQDAPYAEAERSRIQHCLRDIRLAVSASHAGAAADRAARLRELTNIERYVARDLTDRTNYVRERDRSMYLNFRWLADRLPRAARIIVWAATSHIAKDARVTSRYPRGGNFGFYIHRAYGGRAFSLGFSAYGGAFAPIGARASRDLGTAPPGSMEARAMAGNDQGAVYLDRARLAAMGRISASPFFHHPASARWHDVLDGIVIFREERPPRPAR